MNYYEKKGNEEDLALVIKQELSANSAQIPILNVAVSHSEDFDGDEILIVKVIFDGTPKQASIFSNAVRLVSPKLRAIGEQAFPLFSFITYNMKSKV